MHLLWNASTPFYGFELSFLKLIWRIQRNGSWSWTERVSGSRSSIILLTTNAQQPEYHAYGCFFSLRVDVYLSTEGVLL
ncbi:hypothetical protein D9758_011144 [Tetrapyrgos nigripes]|uniref:Uncharacterized protein n=1 Tax=Tetrapyrgos nigripes TaxID=182062 RepID=A0A8H5FMW9_9AGAR|nr:hypothetical protein D9758_011144 [Tetrapyrgos nigripes]